MTPIVTIIHNHTDYSRSANWTAKGATWLPAKGTVEVPYEIWSAADEGQKVAIAAELKNGWIKLELRVLKPNGCQEIIPYSTIGDVGTAPVAIAEVLTKKEEPKAEEQDKNYKVLDNHVVVANSKGMDELAGKFGMKAQIVDQPGVVEVGSDMKDIVQWSGGVVEERGGRGFDKKAEAEEKPAEEPVEEAVEDAVEEAAEEESDELSEEETKEKVNELLSAKKYEEALEVLTNFFGEEQITFKATALRYTKTWDAVVKKWNLSK